MRIVIVGGGTAGWLAALMITRVQGDSHEVTVIESSKIGIVGAGEGSTGFLTDIVQGMTWDYGCDEGDFLRETGATIKLGISHRDWGHERGEYVGPIDGSISNHVGTDYLLCHAILNDLEPHRASFNGGLIARNMSSFYRTEDGTVDNMHAHAYHFDAHRVGRYFRSICDDDVRHIDAEVIDIDVSEDGDVTSLRLSNNQEVAGDLFIDCSGLARIFAKRLGIGWKSYRRHLPVNTALPFLLPHREGEPIAPVTVAWAQSSGWMWMIPTQERWGCGYVFDDSFISPGDALAEVEAALGLEIEPIRTLSFETGRLDTVWHRNCLWLGLSAAFAEPLEATSIHSTIIQLNSLVFHHLRDTLEETCNPTSIAIYNRSMLRMYDDFADFLNIHYTGGRDDSEFWRWVATGETFTDTTRAILDLQRARLLRQRDLDQYPGHAGASLYNWVLAGLGHIGKREAERDLRFSGQADLARTAWSLNEQSLDQMCETMIENTEFIAQASELTYGAGLPK